MMMRHHTKFHEERLSGSEGNPHCDLDLEDSNPKLSRNSGSY